MNQFFNSGTAAREEGRATRFRIRTSEREEGVSDRAVEDQNPKVLSLRKKKNGEKI